MPQSPLSIRIKKIQRFISIPQSGEFDLITANSILSSVGRPSNFTNKKEAIKAVQQLIGLRGSDVDGIPGVVTITHVENFLSPILPPIPSGASLIVSRESLDFIIKKEIGSVAAYNRRYKYPIIPSVDSGITIGIGYDLGYNSKDTIQKDWENHIRNQHTLDKLKAVSGLKRQEAKEKLHTVSSIEIAFDKAKAVFYQTSMPMFAKKVKGIYPGTESLPPDAQGAILSLVYNRGTSLVGERRREMKNLQNLITNKNLNGIAREIRSMKRLWTSSDARGLIIRREQEAVMVEQANFLLRPSEYIFV